MILLAATPRGQGSQAGDFMLAVPGEPVWAEWMCPADEGSLAGVLEGCGCGRAFTGLASGRRTTTAEVVDWPGGLEDLHAVVRNGLRDLGRQHLDVDVLGVVDQMVAVGRGRTVGTLLRRAGYGVIDLARRWPT